MPDSVTIFVESYDPATTTYLVLPDNQITAPFPTEFGKLTKLKALTLDSNEITGTFPPELCGVATCQAKVGNPFLVAPCDTTGCCDLGDGAACPAPTPAPAITIFG